MFLMNSNGKNGLFVSKTAGSSNFNPAVFFLGELFDSEVGNILLVADGRQFRVIFGNIQMVITFESCEE